MSDLNKTFEEIFDDPMDILCERVNHSSIENKPSYNFMNDINVIIDEIIYEIKDFISVSESTYSGGNNQPLELPEIDIPNILVSSGHALCWAVDYTVNKQDFEWLKTEGREYFFGKINEVINLNNTEIYYKILPCYTNLLEIYSLQVV